MMPHDHRFDAQKNFAPLLHVVCLLGKFSLEASSISYERCNNKRDTRGRVFVRTSGLTSVANSSSGEDPAAVTLTYAHCSCRATGRDGVAADAVVVHRGGAAKPRPLEGADAVAARYATRFRGVGRPTRTL